MPRINPDKPFNIQKFLGKKENRYLEQKEHEGVTYCNNGREVGYVGDWRMLPEKLSHYLHNFPITQAIALNKKEYLALSSCAKTDWLTDECYGIKVTPVAQFKELIQWNEHWIAKETINRTALAFYAGSRCDLLIPTNYWIIWFRGDGYGLFFSTYYPTIINK